MKVEEIMETRIISVARTSSIEEIAEKLTYNKLSGIPVLSDGGYLIGIVTEGDLIRLETTPRLPEFINLLGAVIYYKGVDTYNEDFRKILARTAEEIMTEDVIVVKEDAEVSDVVRLMLNNNIKQVPVMDGNKLIGMVYRSDIIKILLKK
ncbi:MAG TPA: CBS domain-containing protein [Candidatus Avacidaminococcus intestinavium]|uniref:CBS domain-containing protein n=1 Tax=Candidatus Avacidaminococcus intestinavium TaxID=2840684 RepID=A0A9D1SKU6_9FIRM|nr:CBS domain-containing protein [Candidatus Avacidaminococcus intestinavium]